MARCRVCGSRSPLIASSLGTCASCIRADPPGLAAHLARVHAGTRRAFGLPPEPPRDPLGIPCDLCANQCRISPDQLGYCGLRRNAGGRLAGGAPTQGNLTWYFDPLPTNCVADWVCPAGTGVGYPMWTHREGPEYGYTNLAVFYRACSFNCLGCQNWHYREATGTQGGMTPATLAAQVDARTACICYFGGDPSPQFPHSVAASVLARRRMPKRILRICWETNGTMHPRWLRKAMAIALVSGGCIKFDLKAWDDRIHRALTGFSNGWTLENFRLAAGLASARPVPPALVASTLLVPGYVDASEVGALARCIARLDPDIPYSLLAFHPQFYLHDLPVTSREHAEEALAAARSAGLTRVRIGNAHLLAEPYDRRSRVTV
ncbi:MAG: radical SAM protein [candidate division NC10 bacterium]|nr:radical SAM protein [candidate division NC10 bacterium]